MTGPWTAPQVERTDPARILGERPALEAWLDFHRATLLLKCAGLTAGQLKERAVPPSRLSLLGLVRHMTEVERWWFRMHAANTDMPFPYDPDSGTRRLEVRLATGRLCPPLRMRLEVDRWTWSPARTVLELIPCKLVRPTAAYFRAGHLLLDSLTHLLPQHAARAHAAGLQIQRTRAADPALAVGLEPGSCTGPGR